MLENSSSALILVSRAMTTPLHVACYRDLKGFVRRRCRAIIYTAGALGTGCLLYYGYSRYTSIPPPASAPSSNLTLEGETGVLQEDSIRHHFQEIQLLADSGLPNAMATFKENLFKLIDISEITRKLLAGKEGPHALNQAEKMQLWQKVKIQSFTRALVSAWGMGLLQLFIRMQLNVLGRRMLISSSLEEQLPSSSQHGFMSTSGFFIQHGHQLLAEDVEHAVNQVLGEVSLKTPYSFDQLRDLFIRIQCVFENQRGKWSRYLLPEVADSPTGSPSASSESYEDEKQDELMADLRGVLSSPEFNEAIVSSLDVFLDFMMEQLLPQYDEQPAVGLPLAKLVPSISSKGTLLERPDNKYFEAVAELPQVKTLCLMVYGNGSV